jgi:CRISPR-associated endoribonuclease Cas6
MFLDKFSVLIQNSFMQIKITLFNSKKIILPIHYNHLIQAFIYNIIDEKLANFLHDSGFGEGRKFKMFTFSRLYGKSDIKSQPGHIIFYDSITLTVSSPYGTFCQSFANGIFKKKIHIGENELEVREAEIIASEVKQNEIVVDTLSPIVVYSTLLKSDGSKYTAYFQPGEKEFERLISENLIKKYKAFKGEDFTGEVKIKPLEQPKLNIVEYKNFIIKGYSGRFKVNGPAKLLQMGVDAGFGSKNSMGFGCVRVVKIKGEKC